MCKGTVQMRAIFSLLIVLLTMLAGAGCSTRGSAPTPEVSTPSTSVQEQKLPEAETISAEAAAAFAELAPVTFKQEDLWRTFRIVPAKSKAAYIVDEELFADATRKYGLKVGKTKVVGETQDLEGLFQLDLSQSAIGPNRFAVYLPTMRTDQPLRDGWIRENALESDRFPLAVFVAERILATPENYREGEEASFQLEGELTLRGITFASIWDVSATMSGATIAGTMQTLLRMTDLGFDPPNFANTLTVQDEFAVRIEFVAQEQ